MRFLIGHDDTAYNIDSLQKISITRSPTYHGEPDIKVYTIVLSFGERFSDVSIYSIRTDLDKQELIKKMILILDTIHSQITVEKLADLIQDDLNSLWEFSDINNFELLV